MPRLGEFLARHPALELEVSCTDRRVDLVREGFDCVVRVGAVNDPSVVARTLGQFPQVTCASPSYLAERGVPQSLDDLAGHQLIHYVTVLGARPPGFEYLHQGEARYIPMGGALSVNNAEPTKARRWVGWGSSRCPFMACWMTWRRGDWCRCWGTFRYHPWKSPCSTLIVACRSGYGRSCSG